MWEIDGKLVCVFSISWDIAPILHCPRLTRGRCIFVHVDGPDLPNNFVKEVCRLVAPGVDSVMGDGNNNIGEMVGEVGAM